MADTVTTTVLVDAFLSDTNAVSLGLYLGRVAQAYTAMPLYGVYRSYDHDKLFHGSRTEVRMFLRGYARALEHPVLRRVASIVKHGTREQYPVSETAAEPEPRGPAPLCEAEASAAARCYRSRPRS